MQVQDDPNYPTPNPQPPQPPTNHDGTVIISGNAKVGESLTANVNDEDGVDEAKVTYQWQRDGQPIANANSKTYTLTAEDEGHKSASKPNTPDNAQHAETPQSGETDAVTGNQTPPRPGSNSEGTIAIDGIERVGENAYRPCL